MAKGPGVSATSHIIATSQTNMKYYSELGGRLQLEVIHHYAANCYNKAGIGSLCEINTG
jgi:hypothetical protein